MRNAVLALAACSMACAASSVSVPQPESPRLATPPAARPDDGPTTGFAIREIQIAPEPTGPSIVAVARDGTVWIALAKVGKLGRIRLDSVEGVELVGLPEGSFPVGLLVDEDDAVWYSDIRRNAIVRLDLASLTTQSYNVPTANAWPFQLLRGQDGAIYATERVGNKIARLEPKSGTFTEVDVPTPHAQPAGMALGRDGAIYFSENSANRIGRYDPSTRTLVELAIPTPASPGPFYGPAGLTTDRNGNIWFAELDGRLGFIDVDRPHEIHEVALPNPAVRPGGVVADRWGLIWFTGLDGNVIGSYDPAHRIFRDYPIPTGRADPRPLSPPEATARGDLPKAGPQAKSTRPFGIAVDDLGRVWFSEQYGQRVGVLYPPMADIVSPPDILSAEARVVTAVRSTLPVQVNYFVDGVQLAQSSRVSAADLSPGDHVWTVSLRTQAGELYRVSKKLHVNTTLDTLALLAAKLTTQQPELARLMTERLSAARAHERGGRGVQANDEIRALTATLEGKAGESLLSYLRSFALFSQRELRIRVTESGECAPSEVTIEAGDAIVWYGPGDWRLATRDGAFASPERRDRDSWRRVFHREGSQGYSCGKAEASVQVVARRTHATRWPMPGPDRVPTVLAIARDQSLWFTAGGGGYASLAHVPVGNWIGHLDRDGTITEYTTPTLGSAPTSIKIAPDGTVWFTLRAASRIAQLVPATGAIREYALPTPDAAPTGIAVAPDGIVWFTEKNAGKIGRLDPRSGEIREFDTPHPKSEPSTIVVDHDGHVWFDERAADQIVRLDPSSGSIDTFAVPTKGSRVIGLVPDRRGYVWFLELAGNKIGRLEIATKRVIEYAIPTPLASPFKAALDRHGRLWFTEAYGNKVGVLDQHGVYEFAFSGDRAMPGGIEIDGQDNVWITEQAGNAIAVLPRAAAFLPPKTDM